jgi:NAD+ synthase
MDDGLGCRMGRVEQMIRYAFWNTGCKGIVVGLSGGIDSAVAAAFCCRAVGPAHVLGLSLPSSVSNPDDIRDARELCSLLKMSHEVISIDPMLDAYRSLPGFVETPYLLGNLMARIRMVTLYYHANRDNRIVCGTSNRSEYMLGYCTKYGDNAADLQPILHLYKTDVYIVARELGIPEPIMTKIPSAGLWEGQSDEKEIGLSYAEIDASLRALERQQWQAQTPTEERVLALVKKSEHKRQPSPNLLAVCPEYLCSLPVCSGKPVLPYFR